MTSHPDQPALEARIDLVHGHVLELQSRVAALEAALRSRSPFANVTTLPATPPRSLPPAASPSAIAEHPAAQTQLQGRIPEMGQAQRRAAARLDELETRGPIRVLAAAGGAAVLLGLALFVGYAIEQDWLAPGVRFVLAAIASGLLTLAAWPITRRGYGAVAGAIGGAGLGGWFAAWLVARHAHELISAPQAFAALAAGAAACLLIADRLRLRLMAGLATVAACATPVLVASGGGRLHELMIYQLLVIVGLVILDVRRRWPELPTIGLAATWLLGASWAAEHGDAGGLGFLAWAGVMLLVSAGSAWRVWLATTEEVERAHGIARVLGAGLASWAASAWVFGLGQGFAGATTVLGVWHLAVAVILWRRGSRAGELFLGFGWLQAFVVGPLICEQAALAWWWIGMAVVAMVVPWRGLARMRDALMVVPIVAAVGWCLAAGEEWSLIVGLGAAAVGLVASLWPREGVERPVGWLAIVATVLWGVVVMVVGPESVVGRFGWGLVPVGVLVGWACARPSAGALGVAVAELGLAVAGGVGALVFDGRGELGADCGVAAMLLGVAGLGVGLIARVRAELRLCEGPRDVSALTAIGLEVAAALGLVALVGVSVVAGSPALGQVGHSLSVAGVGLGLIVAGLRLDQRVWRQVGLAALGVAATKVVLVDLSAAAIGWRALSFVGLGAISIAGAFAYSRASRRACVPS